MIVGKDCSGMLCHLSLHFSFPHSLEWHLRCLTSTSYLEKIRLNKLIHATYIIYYVNVVINEVVALKGPPLSLPTPRTHH